MKKTMFLALALLVAGLSYGVGGGITSVAAAGNACGSSPPYPLAAPPLAAPGGVTPASMPATGSLSYYPSPSDYYAVASWDYEYWIAPTRALNNYPEQICLFVANPIKTYVTSSGGTTVNSATWNAISATMNWNDTCMTGQNSSSPIEVSLLGGTNNVFVAPFYILSEPTSPLAITHTYIGPTSTSSCAYAQVVTGNPGTNNACSSTPALSNLDSQPANIDSLPATLCIEWQASDPATNEQMVVHTYTYEQQTPIPHTGTYTAYYTKSYTANHVLSSTLSYSHAYTTSTTVDYTGGGYVPYGTGWYPVFWGYNYCGQSNCLWQSYYSYTNYYTQYTWNSYTQSVTDYYLHYETVYYTHRWLSPYTAVQYFGYTASYPYQTIQITYPTVTTPVLECVPADEGPVGPPASDLSPEGSLPCTWSQLVRPVPAPILQIWVHDEAMTASSNIVPSTTVTSQVPETLSYTNQYPVYWADVYPDYWFSTWYPGRVTGSYSGYEYSSYGPYGHDEPGPDGYCTASTCYVLMYNMYGSAYSYHGYYTTGVYAQSPHRYLTGFTASGTGGTTYSYTASYGVPFTYQTVTPVLLPYTLAVLTPNVVNYNVKSFTVYAYTNVSIQVPVYQSQAASS